jgi:hypothetical protein
MITLSLCFIFAFLAVPTWGQEVTAAIVGSVNDPTGAAISGATVTATDVNRGTVWTVQTNNVGSFNIPRLPIGTYDVKAVATGFQPVKQSAVTLNLNQTARVNFNMTMGSKSETVEVTGNAPLLQTQSTEVSTVIDAHTLVSVPLAARNYIQLTLLSPGATTVNPESMQLPQNMLNSGRPYINGNREQANSFLLDGQINNETKNNETAYNPSLDAIQEFNLITQNASAEFGNYEGGVINATIKSGTNKYHGDVFEFMRNDKFNANKYWAGMTAGIPADIALYGGNGVAPKPEMRYNMFGGTIGGPVIKNKLFFFADYQGQRYLTAGATGAQLLTAKERVGDFSELCTQFGGGFVAGVCTGGNGAIQLKNPNNGANILNNNLVGAGFAISPVVQKLLASNLYPLPTNNDVTQNNINFKSGTELNNDQGDLKIDYIPSTKDHIYGRWSQMNFRNPVTSNGPIILSAAGGGLITDPIRNAVLNWTHTLSSNFVNEARIGFGAVHYTQQGTSTDSLGNFGEQLGISGANALAPGLLNIQVQGTGSGNGNLGNLGAVQNFHTTEGQVEDNVIWMHGRHNTKAGFQYWRERQDYNYGGNYGQLGNLSISNFSGSTVSDFWLGKVGGGNRDGNNNTLFGLRGNIFAFYVQDDWRVTNTLTVNLGLRFEDHTPLYEVKDRIVNFDLTTGAILTPGSPGTNRALYNNYLGIGDFLPRIGFAWSPSFMNGKTVIRGGYGISEYAEGGGANEELTQNPPFFGAQESAATGNITAGFGPSVAPCPTVNFACYAGKRIRVFDQNYRPALAQQWNLTIQHQITNTLTAQIGYVGQHGTHLLNFFDASQLIGLNAAGNIAKPGELITKKIAGPYLGGAGSPLTSLYAADNSALGGSDNIAGVNMSNSSQRYDALQAVLKKQMGNGLQGQIAYTWSKCMSNSPGYFGTGWGSTNAQSSGGQPGWQNSYDGRADWGPCYFDQKHILTSYVTYQLPVGKGKQFGHDISPALNAVVGNWEIGGIVTLHSGNALTLNEFGGWGAFNGDSSGTNGIGNYFLSARPNCAGPLRTVDKYVQGGTATNAGPGYIQWFDTSNVSEATKNTFGTCSVGNGRGPGLATVDLSLHKGIPLTEGTRLEFRVEAINAFNHRILTFQGGPAGGSFDPGSAFFGQATGSQGSRNLQFALKFYF